MPDSPQTPQPPIPLPDDAISLSGLTALYVDVAEKVAETTRLRHQELNAIIAKIHQANLPA
jgi:hypothetical protein